MDENQIKTLNDLGFFPGPNESQAQFEERVKTMMSWSEELSNKDLSLQDLPYSLKPLDRMSENLLTKSGEPIRVRYGILPNWVPAYFEDKGLPFLTGGMAIQFVEKEGSPLKTFFQLKSIFKHKEKWIIYSANELIRHEMCHVARAPLHSTRYEETFAYSTSDSWLRKKIGGALNTPFDNQLVLLGLLAWISATFLPLFFDSIQAWSSLLYLPFPTIVCLGLFRNYNIHQELKKAKALLEPFFKQHHEKLLFRLNDSEIKELSRLNKADFPKWWSAISGFRADFLKVTYPIDIPAKLL